MSPAISLPPGLDPSKLSKDVTAYSDLQLERLTFIPPLPQVLTVPCTVVKGPPTSSAGNEGQSLPANHTPPPAATPCFEEGTWSRLLELPVWVFSRQEKNSRNGEKGMGLDFSRCSFAGSWFCERPGMGFDSPRPTGVRSGFLLRDNP